MKKMSENQKHKKMSNSQREGRLNFESGIEVVEQWVEITL